ncbi:MAG TPA: hypothetical protein V6D17_02905 [Candidatus Obscuribacterales bacterium]
MLDDEDREEQTSSSATSNTPGNEPLPLIDELGVQDVEVPLASSRGRIFSAAGRFSPLAEFTEREVVLHPPQLPLQDGKFDEEIAIRVDERGILLDELGKPKHIPGAKFRGASLWWLGEMQPGTTKHYVAWFDTEGRPHKLYVNGEALTADIVFRLRNKTHDGELTFFADIDTI